MKRVIFILLVLIVIAFCSCSITSPLPDEGIWYCDELGATIDFAEITGRMYIAEEHYVELEIRAGFDDTLELLYYPSPGYVNAICVCEGYYRYTDDTLTVKAFRVVNFDDNEFTTTEVDDVEYVFKQIKSYDDIECNTKI